MDRTLDLIRQKISNFITARERAYNAIAKKGAQIPDYALKRRAITLLRVQLNASENWDLQANLRWIHAMRHLITRLLPFEFHDDEKQKAYRKHMIDLLNYCDDLLNAQPLLKRAA